MTVSELIRKLSEQAPESEVYFHDPFDGPSEVIDVEFHALIDYELKNPMYLGAKLDKHGNFLSVGPVKTYNGALYFPVNDAVWLVAERVLEPPFERRPVTTPVPAVIGDGI